MSMFHEPKTLKLSTTRSGDKQRIAFSFGMSHGSIDVAQADFAELLEGFRDGFEDVQVTEGIRGEYEREPEDD